MVHYLFAAELPGGLDLNLDVNTVSKYGEDTSTLNPLSFVCQHAFMLSSLIARDI